MINDTTDDSLSPLTSGSDLSGGASGIKPVVAPLMTSPFAADKLEFNSEYTSRPEYSDLDVIDNMQKQNPSASSYDMFRQLEAQREAELSDTGLGTSDFMKSTGLLKDTNRLGLYTGFKSGVHQTFHQSMGDFQDFFNSIGIDMGDSLTNHALAYSEGLKAKETGSALGNIMENPWGAVGKFFGSVGTQVGIMAVPSIAIAAIAPELGIAALASKAYKIASTGEQVIAGISGATKVGYGVRSAYMAQAVALKQIMMLPMQSTYIAMTHSGYTRELMEASGGGMSYGKAALVAFARSYGEGLLETFSAGGRLIETWSMRQIRDKQGELTAALLKNITGGKLKEGGVDVLDTLGGRLMAGVSHPLFSTKSFGINWLSSTLNDPAQEAIQQLYGQAVNSAALDANAFNAQEVADAFISMVPFSFITGIFHAQINTRRQMMETAKTPATAEDMAALKAAMKPADYDRLIERPFARFADWFMVQHAANVKAGTGALSSVSTEVIMSVLDTFKAIAIKTMVISGGQTSPDVIFGRLVPVLTQLDPSQMQEMHAVLSESYAARSIEDKDKRAQAVKAANQKFSDINDANGINSAIDDIANKQKLSDYEYLAKMSQFDARERERNKVNAVSDAHKSMNNEFAKQSGGNEDTGFTFKNFITKTVGSAFQETISKFAKNDVASFIGAIKQAFPDIPDSVASKIVASAGGNAEAIGVVLADVVTRRNLDPASIATDHITPEMFAELDKLGWTATALQERSTEEIRSIIKDKTINPASVKPEASKGKPAAEGEATTPNADAKEVDSAPNASAEGVKKRPSQHNHSGFITDDRLNEIAKVVYDNLKAASLTDVWKKTPGTAIIKMVEAAGNAELIQVIPTKYLHGNDVDALNAKIRALISLQTHETIDTVEEDAVVFPNAHGAIGTITVEADLKDEKSTLKILEAMAEVQHKQNLKDAHAESDLRFVSRLIRSTIQKAILSQAESIRSLVETNDDLEAIRSRMSKAMTEEEKLEILNELPFKVFIDSVVGHLTRGSKDEQGNRVAAILNRQKYVLPPKSSDADKLERVKRIEEDVDAQLAQLLPRFHQAKAVWSTILASEERTMSEQEVESYTEGELVKEDGTKVPIVTGKTVTKQMKPDKFKEATLLRRFLVTVAENSLDMANSLSNLSKTFLTSGIFLNTKGQQVTARGQKQSVAIQNADGSFTHERIAAPDKFNAGGATQTLQQDLLHAVLTNINLMTLYLAQFSDAEITVDNFAHELLLNRQGWGRAGGAGNIWGRLMDKARVGLGKKSTGDKKGLFTAEEIDFDGSQTLSDGASGEEVGDYLDYAESRGFDPTEILGDQNGDGVENGRDARLGATVDQLREMETRNLAGSIDRHESANDVANISVNTQVSLFALRALLADPKVLEDRNTSEIELINVLKKIFGISGNTFVDSMENFMQTTAVAAILQTFKKTEPRKRIIRDKSKSKAKVIDTEDKGNTLLSDNPQYRFVERLLAATKNEAIAQQNKDDALMHEMIRDEIPALKVRKKELEDTVKDMKRLGITSKHSARFNVMQTVDDINSDINEIDIRLENLDKEMAVVNNRIAKSKYVTVSRQVTLKDNILAFKAAIADLFTIEQLKNAEAIVMQAVQTQREAELTAEEKANKEFDVEVPRTGDKAASQDPNIDVAVVPPQNTSESHPFIDRLKESIASLRDPNANKIGANEAKLSQSVNEVGATVADIDAKIADIKSGKIRKTSVSGDVNASEESQRVFGLQYNRQVGNEERPHNIIVLLNDATPETVMHEFMHHLMSQDIMPKEYQDILRRAYGNDEEELADAMVAYMRVRGKDLDFSKNPELEPAVKWVMSSAAVMGKSISDILPVETSKFFDIVLKEHAQFKPGSVATATKVALSRMMNSNSYRTPVAFKDTNTAIAKSESAVTYRQILEELGDTYGTGVFPAYSMKELLELTSQKQLGGNAIKQLGNAPMSVITRGQQVAMVIIDVSALNDVATRVLLSRMEKSGFDLNNVQLVLKGGSMMPAIHMERTVTDEEATIADINFNPKPENESVKIWMNDATRKITYVATRTIKSILFNLSNPDIPWSLTKVDNINKPKSGVLVGLSEGKLSYSGSEVGTVRTVSKAAKVHVLIDPSIASADSISEAVAIKDADVQVISKDGTIVSLEKYLTDNKIVDSNGMNASAENIGKKRPYPAEAKEFFGYVDKNGFVYTKQRMFYEDNHYTLFGSHVMTQLARFRYDARNGKVNWLNNPSQFERQMMQEHAIKNIDKKARGFDHIPIDDGTYLNPFNASYGKAGSMAETIARTLKYGDTKLLTELMSADELKGVRVNGVSITIKNGIESGVVFDPETNSIVVTVSDDVTLPQKERLISHGVALADWNEKSNDPKTTSAKLFANYNKVGLVTSSDFLMSNPNASFWSEPNDIISASMEGKTDREILVHRIDKLMEFYKAFMTTEGGGKHVGKKAFKAAKINIMRDALGDMWKDDFADMKNLKKDDNSYDLISRIVDHMESIMGIEAEDPLHYRVQKGESIEEAKIRDHLTIALVDQLNGMKTLDRVGDTDVGGAANYKRVKKWIAERATGAASVTQSIWGIAKFLDHGNPDGVFTKLVRELIMPGLAKAKEMEANFPVELEENIRNEFAGRPDLLDEDGKVPYTLNKEWTLAGKKFTGAEVIGLYLASGKGNISKKEDGKYASKTVAKLLRGSKVLTEEMIAAAKVAVEGDAYLQGYQNVISKMFKQMWTPLNKTHMELNNGREIGNMGDNFFPLMWNFQDEEVRASKDVFEFFDEATNGDAVTTPSHAMARSASRSRASMPLFNAWEVLRVYNSHVTNYIAKGKNINTVLEVITNPEVIRLAGDKFTNTRLLNAFREMAEREMTLTGRMDAYGGFDRELAGWRQKVSVAQLKGNPGPILKQYTSGMMAMTMLPMSSLPKLMVRIGEAYVKTLLFTATKRFSSAYSKSNKGYLSNSEMAWSGNTEFADMLRDNPILRKRIIELNSVKIGTSEIPSYLGRGQMTVWQRALDAMNRGPTTLRVTDSGICFALYKTSMEAEMANQKKLGVDDATAKINARAFANEVIRVSNDPSNFTEMSLLQTSRGEFIKGAMPFAGFAFKNFQLATENVLFPAVMAYTNKDGSELSKILAGAGAMTHNYKVFIWAFIIPAMVLAEQARGRPPKDKEEALGDVLAYSFGTLPLVGQYLQSMTGKTDSVIYNALWQDSALNIFSAFSNLYRSFTGAEELDLFGDAKKTAMFLAGIKGQPIYNVRLATRLIEYSQGKDVGADADEVMRFMFLGNSDTLQRKKDELEAMRKKNVEAKILASRME